MTKGVRSHAGASSRCPVIPWSPWFGIRPRVCVWRVGALQFGLLLSSFLSNCRDPAFRKGSVESRSLKTAFKESYLTQLAISTSPPDPSWFSGRRPRSSRLHPECCMFSICCLFHMLFANFHSLKNKNQNKCFHIMCEQIAFMT